MTARSAATIASLALLGFVTACTSFYEIPIETPISPKMDVSPFQRVLVAGFISGGTEDVDANLETGTAPAQSTAQQVEPARDRSRSASPG